MSIILKPSALKVKDDNGNYIGTNMFAAESTQEYLDAIETIGTQTQTAIQNKSTQAQAAMEAKAEQTIESIPDDYTELAGDVTELKANLSAVSNVLVLDDAVVIPFTVINSERFIKYSTGDVAGGLTQYYYTDYIDISAYKSITYTRPGTTSANIAAGMAFYTSSKTYINGDRFAVSQSEVGYVDRTLTVPENAKYARFTVFKDTTTYGDFELQGVAILSDTISGLKADIDTALSDIDYGLYGHTVFEQGSISASTGADSSVTEYVRTADFIPIESFSLAYKTVGVEFILLLYDTDKTYITYINLNTNNLVEYRRATIVSSYPTAKYVRARAKISGQSTTVAQLTATGTYVEVVLSVDDIKETVDSHSDTIEELSNFASEYIVYTDLTLTEGEYTYTVPYDKEAYRPMVITCKSKYTGTRPTIKFSKIWKGRTGLDGMYYTMTYPISNAVNIVEQSWRIPPYFAKSRTYATITITVPADTTLYIESLYNYYEATTPRPTTGIRLNAHGTNGFGGPQNTIVAFEMAAKLGYPACITIPKVTSDGVLVCLHNDDDIGNYVYYDDGTAVPNDVRQHPISYYTYQQMMQFDLGIYRGLPFKGQRLPKLEEFFAICAKTGMKPMLSVHPSLSGHWDDIKALAEAYGVLSSLGIKSDHSTIAVPMVVLGDDVESYTIDTHVTTTSDMSDLINEFDSYKSTYSLTNVRCVIEGMEEEVWTDANITLVKNAGYDLAFVNTTDLDLMQTLISKGIHEFTEDYIASSGLVW